MFNLNDPNNHGERLVAHILTWFLFIVSFGILGDALGNYPYHYMEPTPERDAISGLLFIVIISILLYLFIGVVGFFSRGFKQQDIKEKAAKELAALRNSPTAVMLVEEGGIQGWWQSGVRHRVDGPAIINSDGSQRWLRHGELHREDGPAMVDANGAEAWFLLGKLHRTDGPALTSSEGIKSWYFNNVRSRYDGPAVEFPDGTVQYWIDGRELSKAEHDLAKKPLDND